MAPPREFITALAIESWTLYSVGMIAIFGRLISRRIHLGSYRKLQLDDYIMLLVIVPFTMVIVAANEVSKHGSSYSRLQPGRELIDIKEQKDLIRGSKMSFITEESLVITLWLLKACFLLMLHRLSLGLWQQRLITLVALYCAIGFVVMEILLFGVWCRPFYLYWAIPVPPSKVQCATYYHHMIVASVFNLSSHITILLLPLPILIHSIMPLKRKILLCFVFSLGIFVILAAILNRYYNFTQKFSLVYLNWYVGEVSTAVIVANIPLMWPLLRRLFALSPWGPSEMVHETDQSALDSFSTKRADVDLVNPGDSTRKDSVITLGPLVKHETDASLILKWNQGLNDMRGNTGYRPRGYGSVAIEDIDVDVEMARLSPPLPTTR